MAPGVYWRGWVNLSQVISMARQPGQSGESTETSCRIAAIEEGEAR